MSFKRKASIFTVLLVVIMIFMAPTNAFAGTVGDVLTIPEDGWRRYDNSYSLIKYVGNWTVESNLGAYNNSDTYTNSNEGNLVFKFYGTKLRIISNPYNNKPTNVPITIDGTTETFSMYSSGNLKQIINYEKTELELGIHTVVISAPSSMPNTQNILIDAIDIDEFGYLIDINKPLNLKATPSDTEVALTWEAVEGATSYNIKRSEIAGGPYTTVDSVSGSAITYVDIDVINGKKYYYVITAETTSGESANSNEVAASPSSSSTITGNKAILVISFNNGKEKEYDLTAAEIDKFVTWYDAKSDGAGKSYFTLPKRSNVKPFIGRKEYIKFDNIESFEIKDYNE